MNDSYRYGAGYKMNEDIQSKSEMKRQKALRESKSVDLKALREKAVARDADGYVNMIVGTEVILAMIERLELLEGIAYSAERWRNESAGQDTSMAPTARRIFFERLDQFFYPELNVEEASDV